MSYEEAEVVAREDTSLDAAGGGDDISRADARELVSSYAGDWAQFLKEVGDRQAYSTEEVLLWLGY